MTAKAVVVVFCFVLFVLQVSCNSITCDSVGLSVQCDIALSEKISAEEYRVWWQRSDKAGPLVSQTFPSSTTTLQIFRFVPLTDYTIVAELNGRNLTATLRSGSSGVESLDTAPLATISGTPSFELLFLDLGNAYTMIDTTGWVVWFFNTDGNLPMEPAQAKAQFSDYNFALINNGNIELVNPNMTVLQ